MGRYYWTPQTAAQWLLLMATAGPARASVPVGTSRSEQDPRLVSILLRVVEYDAERLPDTMDHGELQRAIDEKMLQAQEIARDASALEQAGGEVALASRYLRASLIDHLGVAIHAWNPARPRGLARQPGSEDRFRRIVEQTRRELAGPFEARAVEQYREVLHGVSERQASSSWAWHARAALHRLERTDPP
jgi:hypothetical protein